MLNSTDRALLREVYDLADACLRGDVSDGEAARLERLVCENDNAGRFYIQCIRESHGLSIWARRGDVSDSTECHDLDAMLLEQLRRESLLAPGGTTPDDLAARFAAFGAATDERSAPDPSVESAHDPGAADTNGHAPGNGHVGGVVRNGAADPDSSVRPLSASRSATTRVGRWARTTARFMTRPASLSIVMAGLTLACVTLTLMLIQLSGEPATTTLEVDDPINKPSTAVVPVARVAAAREVVWDDESSRLHIGQALFAGDVLRLKSGDVQAAFDDGTRVVVHGPATFRFETSQQGWLQRGSISAAVPPAAKGFSVRTPAADVIDLGTEFGVRVDSAGASIIRVFVGEVDVHFGEDAQQKQKALSRRLVAGQSLKVLPAGDLTVPGPLESSFFRVDQFDSSRQGLLLRDRFRAGVDGYLGKPDTSRDNPSVRNQSGQKLAPEPERDDTPKQRTWHRSPIDSLGGLGNHHVAERLLGQGGTMVGGSGVGYSTSGRPRILDVWGNDRRGVLALRSGDVASPDMDFSTDEIERAGGFAVEIDFSTSVFDHRDLLRWVGLRLLGNRESRTGDWRKFRGAHFHLRSNGQFSFHEGGVKHSPLEYRPRFTPAGRGWHTVRVEVEIDAFDGKSPARIRAFAGGSRTPFYTHTTPGGYRENYVSVEYEAAYSPQKFDFGLIDDLRVQLLNRQTN